MRRNVRRGSGYPAVCRREHDGERLVVEMSGGGGYGDPKARDPALLRRDVEYGLVSAAQAARDYGVKG